MKIILYVFLIFLIPVTSFAEDINTNSIKFTMEIKVKTLDGNELQTAELKIVGDSLVSPFKWSVVVVNQGHQIFKLEKDDTWLNKFFSDAGYILSCEGYNACKEKWYFKELPLLVEAGFTYVGKDNRKTETWQLESVDLLASEYLSSQGIPESEIKKVLVDMKALLASGGYAKISLPKSSVEMEPSYMYVPRIHQYVPYEND